MDNITIVHDRLCYSLVEIDILRNIIRVQFTCYKPHMEISIPSAHAHWFNLSSMNEVPVCGTENGVLLMRLVDMKHAADGGQA